MVTGAILAAGPHAWAQVPVNPPRVPLPYDLVDTLDGAKFKLRVPANWNGTLLVFVQGTKTGPPPPEPRLAPPVLPGGTDPPLETTLLGRGYALAASEIAAADWQIKAAVQDTLALTAFFRARVGEPNRVIVWGASLGGLATAKLAEDHPRILNGAVAACGPLAGFHRRLDQQMDIHLAYASVFGWPASWGSVGDLRSGLNVPVDVNPFVNWPKPDGSNRAEWEFIRIVNGLEPDAFWKTDPGLGFPSYFLQMFLAFFARGDAERWASGPVSQNLDHHYDVTAADRKYLAGLGLHADHLLAKMNAADIQAAPRAREFATRFGEVHGTLTKPLVTIHNTLDTLADTRNENAYRKTVEAAGAQSFLVQSYVTGLGHCGFTAQQWLTALAALEGWLTTGSAPGPSAFPAALGFDNYYVPPPWPY